MKFILFLMLLSHSCLFAQVDWTLNINFVVDNDSFPDCRTVYSANGSYSFSTWDQPEIDIPNTLAVNPVRLNSDGNLRFHSYAPKAKKLGSIELDELQIVPYTREEVRELILAGSDSILCDWKMRDSKYLWENYNITFDAKPAVIPEAKPIENALEVEPFSGPINITGGILDGIYIDDRQFVRLEPLRYKHLPKSFIPSSSDPSQNLSQEELDRLLQPFYISEYELTNGEYREFINWVADSIELHMAYANLEYEDAVLLLDCSNKERKKWGSLAKQVGLERFGLSRKHQKKIDIENWLKATTNFYYPRPQRYYKRRERDTRRFIYKQNESTSVAIYPDTNGFRIPELATKGDYLANLSWHPAFDDYPVVNVTSEQIMAYCHWKQLRINKEINLDNYKIVVRPPTITEYEFATKASLGEEAYLSALDKPNDYFITNKRTYDSLQQLFCHSVFYNPFGKLKKTSAIDSRLRSLEYNLWYQANQSESTLKFLNGNVSEMVIDEITPELAKHYRIESSHSQGNFVLGSNYLHDVKTYGDDQYNAVFYKTVLEKGKSSPNVGFRLVYMIEEIE